MSEFEQVFKVESSQYGDLVMLQKRGDVYGVYAGQESKEGTNFMRWVFPQKRIDGKNVPADKAIPQGFRIGNRTEAVAFFKWGLAAMGETVTPKNEPDSDIPF